MSQQDNAENTEPLSTKSLGKEGGGGGACLFGVNTIKTADPVLFYFK